MDKFRNKRILSLTAAAALAMGCLLLFGSLAWNLEKRERMLLGFMSAQPPGFLLPGRTGTGKTLWLSCLQQVCDFIGWQIFFPVLRSFRYCRRSVLSGSQEQRCAPPQAGGRVSGAEAKDADAGRKKSACYGQIT